MPKTAPRMWAPTWEVLIMDEPRLAELLAKTEAIKDDGSTSAFCANSHWYGRAGQAGLKQELVELVGWARHRGVGYGYLWDSASYDVAYETIYAALPDCRNCACV